MEFTVKGNFLGDDATLTWKDGKLSCSHPEAFQLFQETIQEYEKEQVEIGYSEVGPFFTGNYLAHPLSAILLLQRMTYPFFKDFPNPDDFLPEGFDLEAEREKKERESMRRLAQNTRATQMALQRELEELERLKKEERV